MFIRILIFAIVTISYWKFNSLILFCLLTRTCRKKTIELFCHFAQWRECFAPQWDGTSAAITMLKNFKLKRILNNYLSSVFKSQKFDYRNWTVLVKSKRSWRKTSGQKSSKTAQIKVGGQKLENGLEIWTIQFTSESSTFRWTIRFWAQELRVSSMLATIIWD